MAGPRRAKALGGGDPFYAHASATLLSEVPADPQVSRAPIGQDKEWMALFGHLESRFQALYTWRVSWWTTWSQISRYMLPRRFYAFITGNMYNQGLREDFAIVDRTATMAGEVCAAGLMATLTDPDRPWLRLGPAIPNFALDAQAKTYYEDVTERLNYVYDHSNFYESQAQMYEDMTFFGTGTVIDYEDEENILRCFTPCMGEYMLGVNFGNEPETFYREFRQTISQTVEMFGIENCPPDVVRMWTAKGGSLEYENVIGHSIEPNFAVQGAGNQGVGVVPGGFAWREVYWVRGKKDYRPLSMTGFHEQPHASCRWSTQSNEPYGRGVGENMLGDAIQLQIETRQKAESIEKVNRPPMGADVALMNLPSSTNPGKITYMNTANGGEKKFFPLYEIKPDIPAIVADIAVLQQRIAKTAYNDIFQMMMNLRQNVELKADVTATEVDKLTEEALMRLGPMMGRTYGALRQRVTRHIEIMGRKGLLPPKPLSLRGVPTKIDFISVLTEARRAVKTQAIARTMQFAGSLSGAWPEVKFVVDPDEAVRAFADGVGASPKIIRTADQSQALIAQAQKSEQQQQLLAQTAPGAQAAKALSETSLAPGSALSALVGSR
jgi:hypothetical protein